jgi:hypothetical protein
MFSGWGAGEEDSKNRLDQRLDMTSSTMKRKRLENRKLVRIVDQIREMDLQEHTLSWRQRVRLLMAWGNIGYSASARYLQHVERVFRESHNAVLECGSGATTVLLGLLAEQGNRYVWTFEHNREWFMHMREVVKRLKLKRVMLFYAPLECYGEYEWYRVPEVPLPRDFGMVICDGPPGMIRGGRYGFFPVMGHLLNADCRILLDDTHRPKERELIRRWECEEGILSESIGVFGTCAELTLA